MTRLSSYFFTDGFLFKPIEFFRDKPLPAPPDLPALTTGKISSIVVYVFAPDLRPALLLLLLAMRANVVALAAVLVFPLLPTD